MKKYYAVIIGHTPGIYDSWLGFDGARSQINGFPNAFYKAFNTLEDAEDWYYKLQRPTESVPESDCNPIHSSNQTISEITIYADGSALGGNPGYGGYGVIILKDGHKNMYSGGFNRTTNNRMELMGCIVGLEQLQSKSKVTIFTDSKYVVDSINKGWALNWKKNGWKKSDGKPAENIDLWERLLMLCSHHHISFCKIKGHAGTYYNEECDRMAKKAASGFNLPKDTGYKGSGTDDTIPDKPDYLQDREVADLWNMIMSS